MLKVVDLFKEILYNEYIKNKKKEVTIMKITDLTNVATNNSILPTNKIINSAIRLDKTNYDEMFDGSFEAIYKAVRDDIIKPLVIEDNIVGISYNSKCTSIEEDNKAGYAFQKAYSDKPISEYCLLSWQLVTANLVADKVVENEYGIYAFILSKGIIINPQGEVICQIDISDYKYREDIEEDLDYELEQYISDAFYDECDECDEEYDEYEDDKEEKVKNSNSLPTEVVISKLVLVKVDESSIRKYLREVYDHYLSSEMKDLNYEVKGPNVYVKDIKWGRKK